MARHLKLKYPCPFQPDLPKAFYLKRAIIGEEPYMRWIRDLLAFFYNVRKSFESLQSWSKEIIAAGEPEEKEYEMGEWAEKVSRQETLYPIAKNAETAIERLKYAEHLLWRCYSSALIHCEIKHERKQKNALELIPVLLEILGGGNESSRGHDSAEFGEGEEQ